MLSKQNYTLRTKNEVCANSLLQCLYVPFKSGTQNHIGDIYGKWLYLFKDLLEPSIPLLQFGDGVLYSIV